MTGILLYLIIGIAVGILGAMLGIGGGIIIVPLMTFVFGATPQQAVGTSMVVVLFNSLSGSIGYLRRKMVFLDAAWKFALATIPGAILGSYVADTLQGKVFYGIFGVFFALFAVNMFYQAGKKSSKDDSCEVPAQYNWKLGTGFSVGVGFLASILGIGGGVIHVPMMTYLLKFPVKVAIATSTAILSVSAIAGATSHALMGHVLWLPALSLGVGACIGAQLGVKTASKAKSSLLLRLTAGLVFVMGIKFLMELF